MVIKVRAWDADNQHMVYDLSDMVGDTLNHYLLAQRDDGSICIMREGDGKELPTMLSTGIRDYNGAEIWEGDVLKDADGIFWADWDHHEGRWATSDTKNKLSDTLKSWNEDAEVVGNIYQHPHLLERTS